MAYTNLIYANTCISSTCGAGCLSVSNTVASKNYIASGYCCISATNYTVDTTESFVRFDTGGANTPVITLPTVTAGRLLWIERAGCTSGYGRVCANTGNTIEGLTYYQFNEVGEVIGLIGVSSTSWKIINGKSVQHRIDDLTEQTCLVATETYLSADGEFNGTNKEHKKVKLENTIGALAAGTVTAGTDYIPFYDASETSYTKLKKVLICDLPSGGSASVPDPLSLCCIESTCQLDSGSYTNLCGLTSLCGTVNMYGCLLFCDGTHYWQMPNISGCSGYILSSCGNNTSAAWVDPSTLMLNGTIAPAYFEYCSPYVNLNNCGLVMSFGAEGGCNHSYNDFCFVHVAASCSVPAHGGTINVECIACIGTLCVYCCGSVCGGLQIIGTCSYYLPKDHGTCGQVLTFMGPGQTACWCNPGAGSSGNVCWQTSTPSCICIDSSWPAEGCMAYFHHDMSGQDWICWCSPGGGASPGGSCGHLQFNDGSGGFGACCCLYWNTCELIVCNALCTGCLNSCTCVNSTCYVVCGSYCGVDCYWQDCAGQYHCTCRGIMVS
jgi:hypothetical protein